MVCVRNLWSLCFWQWCGLFALLGVSGVVFCLFWFFFSFFKNRLNKCPCAIAVDISDYVVG